jgi:phosphoribosylformylglycinamidine cyclo-ligase
MNVESLHADAAVFWQQRGMHVQDPTAIGVDGVLTLPCHARLGADYTRDVRRRLPRIAERGRSGFVGRSRLESGAEATTEMDDKPSSPSRFYADAGVDEPREQRALGSMLHWFKKTYAFRRGIGATVAGIGHFANVLDLGHGIGVVLTTDGVGTKLLIAQELMRFDTVGIDCVANNVNDLLCLGAEPVAMLDYLAISEVDEQMLEDLAKGLCAGAEQAHISIPGGEIAQIGEMLSRHHRGPTVDVVGCALGVVSLSPASTDLPPLVDGRHITPGDAIIGLTSSGLHSNGYSLARKVLLHDARLPLPQHMDELGRTLGDELLEPTRIYVDAVLPLLRRRLLKGLVNVSGGGLLSLGRLPVEVSYLIEDLPPPPPIFTLIQSRGSLPDTAMFAAFNMGIGFCLICDPSVVATVLRDVSAAGYQARHIGRVIEKPGKSISIAPAKLVGRGETFTQDR